MDNKPNGQQAPQQPSQKLIDFNNELKALCDKYQYEMQPVLVANQNSIIAQIQVVDISPKVEGVNLKTQLAPGGIITKPSDIDKQPKN